MIIAKVVTLQAGYRAEQKELKSWVGGWHTDVTLKGGGSFNSCFFDFYEDGKSLNVYADERFQKYKFIK